MRIYRLKNKIIIAIITLYFFFYQKTHKTTNLNNLLCIIGNSENTTNAQSIHDQWSGRFPSVWNIWGEPDSHAQEEFDKIHFLFKSSATWAQGLFETLKFAREKYDCEYYFTHDDDLFFFSINGESKDESLTYTLKSFKPAIVGFPYDVFINNRANGKRIFHKFQQSKVAPLTGFDSGMVIYHSSIVDFFIPYSPRGEGGFVGEWSLCAHFINMFAPLIFREYAIQINSIKYRNHINMDNLPKSKKKTFHLNSLGQTVPEGSRHPYEYEKNSDFFKYLESGLLVSSMRWGRELDVHDVTWWPSKMKNNSYNKIFVLERLASFYNLSHPLIQNNVWINKHFSKEYISSIAKSQKDRIFGILEKVSQCTMVITVFDRYKLTRQVLRFYQSLKILNAIILIWNNPTVDPPVILNPENLEVPVIILKMPWNSLNNRFMPRSQIKTECVINMDDDVLSISYHYNYIVPHDILTEAAHVWRHNSDRIVGYRNTARKHVLLENGTFLYGRRFEYEELGNSMVLPSGMIYHRDYLDKYMEDSVYGSRRIVDQTMNCDDILFNFVVANYTKKPPLILDLIAKPKKLKKGLWKRSSHFETRSKCINRFVEEFHGMPLEYTNSYEFPQFLK